MFDVMTQIGGILGIMTFFWRVWDAYGRFLRISLGKPELEGSFVAVRTEVQNKSFLRKKIDNALVLFGPHDESPIETARAVVGPSGPTIQVTNDLEYVQTTEPIYAGGGRGIIPLPFFYSEQVSIGDEHLGFRCLIPTEGMERDSPYAIRFFVFAHRRLHRSTHEAIVLPSE